MVGCVIVDQTGKIVGEGFHPGPGSPHAEIYALNEAGSRAIGSTVYVTLEPCSHYGRTPPCADALVAARVGRVVVAMLDPDVRVSGNGMQILNRANIETSVGILEEEARSLNRSYIFHRENQMPWVTVKIAMTLDGKTATSDGDSKWITGPITRRWVHRQLRDRTDAILIGVGTVILDNPLLTTRLTTKPGRDPVRVILDSNLRTPLDSLVIGQGKIDGKTIIACLDSFDLKKGKEIENAGAILVPIRPDMRERVDLRVLLSTLGTTRDISTVLIEGGASIIASAIGQGLVNRYVTTIAPKLIGGKSAIGPIGGNGLAGTMNTAVRLRQWKARRCAQDLVIDALL
jgi:diaminohydroxyphosphoribosylaminopyrimidine deaminase/5-amino-6-(5-phosphoribosylamino)uracil reductase